MEHSYPTFQLESTLVNRKNPFRLGQKGDLPTAQTNGLAMRIMVINHSALFKPEMIG